RLTGAGDLAEGAVSNFASHTTGNHELSVIKYVEKLRAEFKVHSFTDRGVLVQSQIPIIDSRSVKEPPLCVADGTQSFGGKRRRIEEQMPWLTRIQEMNRFAAVVRYVRTAAAAQ